MSNSNSNPDNKSSNTEAKKRDGVDMGNGTFHIDHGKKAEANAKKAS